jgi:hypothetical protein
MRVFLIPDTSCCLQVLTGISRLCWQAVTNGRRTIRVQNRDPVKDRDNKSTYFHLDSKYGVLSLLFNDAHNCYVYTASVTEECGTLVEWYWQGKTEVLVEQALPLCLPKIPYSQGSDLALRGKRAATNRQSTARPLLSGLTHKLHVPI